MLEHTSLDAPPDMTFPPLFRNRKFLMVWTGDIISVLGDAFHTIALGLWVLKTTGSASAMALVMATKMIVTILLGTVAGTVSDRTDRRRILIMMDLTRFLLVLVVAYTLGRGDISTVTPLVVLTGLISICSIFHGPCFSASFINIVGQNEVQKATSVVQMGNILAKVVGFTLAGLVIAMTNYSVAMLVDATSYLISALFVLGAGHFPSPVKSSEHRSFFGHMREGLAFLRDQPLIRALAIQSPLNNFFVNTLLVLVPITAVKLWGVDSRGYGFLQALLVTGMIIGVMLLLLRDKHLKRIGTMILSEMVILSILSTGILLLPNLTVAALPIVVAGALAGQVNVLLSGTLRRVTPPEMQGRVLGTINSLSDVATPISMLVAGALADMFTPRVVGVGMCLLWVVTSVITLFAARSLREYQVQPKQPATP